MKYLLIDTSCSYPVISIVINNNISFLFNEKIESDMSSKIMSIIDKGLRKSNIKIDDINKIFVVNGPGSFTGIRIGVAIAKTIAWSLKKEIVTLSSLELLATTVVDTNYVIPMIDARRGNVFAGIYDVNLNVIKKDKMIDLHEILKFKESYKVVSYDANFENKVFPKIDVLKIIKKHEQDETLNPHNVNPNYLKLTEAEENKLKND